MRMAGLLQPDSLELTPKYDMGGWWNEDSPLAVSLAPFSVSCFSLVVVISAFSSMSTPTSFLVRTLVSFSPSELLVISFLSWVLRLLTGISFRSHSARSWTV